MADTPKPFDAAEWRERVRKLVLSYASNQPFRLTSTTAMFNQVEAALDEAVAALAAKDATMAEALKFAADAVELWRKKCEHAESVVDQCNAALRAKEAPPTVPEDIQLIDLFAEFHRPYQHAGTTFDDWDGVGFAREVLRRWGAEPAVVNQQMTTDPWILVSDRLPDLKPGTAKEFIVQVRRSKYGKDYVFAAEYLNQFRVTSEDDDADDEGGKYISGWYTEQQPQNDDAFYMPVLDDGDAVIAWQPMPAPLVTKESGNAE